MLAPRTDPVNEPHGVAGWLAVLCLLLLVYHPVSFALTATMWLNAISIRGAPLVILLVSRLGITGLGVAAGIALIGTKPGALALSQVALGLSGAVDMFTYLAPVAPNNRPPGDTPYYVAGSLLYHVAWIVYVTRSTRIRNTMR